jgi:hypothetical protein
MYAICNIVCGTEIPDNIRSYMNEVADGEYTAGGFKTFYSGSGDTPAYSGIVLSRFDECSNMRASQLRERLVANPNQLNQARQALVKTKEIFQELLGEDEETSNEEKQALLNSIPQEPDIFLIWSSS